MPTRLDRILAYPYLRVIDTVVQICHARVQRLRVWIGLIRSLPEERASILLLARGQDLLFAIDGVDLVVISILTSHLPCPLYRVHLQVIGVRMRNVLCSLQACQVVFERYLTFSVFLLASALDSRLIDQVCLRVTRLDWCLSFRLPPLFLIV